MEAKAAAMESATKTLKQAVKRDGEPSKQEMTLCGRKVKV